MVRSFWMPIRARSNGVYNKTPEDVSATAAEDGSISIQTAPPPESQRGGAEPVKLAIHSCPPFN